MNSRVGEPDGGRARQYGMLASALAGRPVEVTTDAAGGPAWTDGHTITIDPACDSGRAVEAVVVQAALIGAASLVGDVMRPLLRRSRLRQRYLEIEGPRAVAGMRDLLPRPLEYMICEDIASLSTSPATSLALARKGTHIPDCGLYLGTLRPREVLSALRTDTFTAAAGESGALVGDGNDPDSVSQVCVPDDAALFSAGGGSTIIGRLLAALLHGAGVTSVDGPVGGQHVVRRRAPGNPTSTLIAEGVDSDEPDEPVTAGKYLYPEWDSRRHHYRDRWSTVRVADPPEAVRNPVPASELGLRRPLARLGTGPQLRHRQPYGDDIDIDAIIASRAGALTAPDSDQHYYLNSVHNRRDLASLILLDVSGSTAEPGVGRISVHDHQRALVSALVTTMQRVGDRVAVYAFSSQGRHDVRLQTMKSFAERNALQALARLQHLQPAGYSRLGAAIRHGAHIIERDSATTRRLLIVVSDGIAFDHGYDLNYGARDVRYALTEARSQGTGCLCLTVGATAPAEDLREAFGTAAYASVPGPESVAPVFERLARTALRHAEVRRHRHRPERTSLP